MGRTHVLSTGALGLAIAAPVAASYLHHTMSVSELLVFTAVTAGYGLLPDIDHQHSTLAHTFGPVTRVIATTIGRISGGHRKFTHTVWMAALMVVLVELAAKALGNWANLVIAWIGLYLAAMVLRLAPKHTSGPAELLYAIEAAAVVAAWQHFGGGLSAVSQHAAGATVGTNSDGIWWFLPWAVGFGVIGHIVGDILTTEGVPIFYPLAPHFVVRVPILGSTDHWREKVFAFLLVPAIAWLTLAAVTGNHWYELSWATEPSNWKFTA